MGVFFGKQEENGANVKPGIFFVRINGNNYAKTGKILIQ